MIGSLSVGVVMPALDEAGVIGPTLESIPGDIVDVVWVADNGSVDDTAAEAEAHGARVVREPRRGYGAACQAALREMRRSGPPDAVVFIDADGSQPIDELPLLLRPIADDEADFVIGVRRFADTPSHVSIGNRVSCMILQWLTGHKFGDLGPFRAIRFESLQSLALRDLDYGWNVEMQARAVAARLRIREVPVSHRPRKAGRSKISGSLVGTFRAGGKIILTSVREGWRARRERPEPGSSIEGRRKPLKDVDSTARARLYSVLAWLVPVSFIFFIIITFAGLSAGTGLVPAILVGVLLGIGAPFLVYGLLYYFVIGGTASFLGRLYGGGTSGSPTPPTYWRAQALSVRGFHAEALEAWEVEAAQDPGDPGPCLRAAALCIEELGDPRAAAGWYERARSAERITPETDAYVSMRLADLYESAGEEERVTVELRRLLERHPGSQYAAAARSRLAALRAKRFESRESEQND